MSTFYLTAGVGGIVLAVIILFVAWLTKLTTSYLNEVSRPIIRDKVRELAGSTKVNIDLHNLWKEMRKKHLIYCSYKFFKLTVYQCSKEYSSIRYRMQQQLPPSLRRCYFRPVIQSYV